MSSTMCFTKGHSTRISSPSPCGSYRRVTERFGLRILFAGLFFVLLFGLFAVPVAAEDDLSPKLRVLSIEDRLLTSIDGDTIYLNSPIIFAVDVPANADIKVNQDRYPEEELVMEIVGTGNGLDSHTFSLYVSDTVGTTEYIEYFFSSSDFPNGEYDVKVKYQKADGTTEYTNTVSFTVSSEQDIALSGLGTESNPYLIQLPGHLKLLSDEVKSGKTFADTYFAITDNLDLSLFTDWQPIGDMLIGFDLTDTESPYGGIVYYAYSQNIFCGIVDGRGNTISHLKTDNKYGGSAWDFNGLFGVVGPGTVIKNLILTDVDVSSGGYHYTGGLIGGIYGYKDHGSDTILIENCHVEGYVDGNGGLIGRAYSEAAPITISKCSAKVSGVLDSMGGGLIGVIDSYSASADITISECFVSLKENIIQVEAGFASSVSAVEGNVLIKDCYVSGNSDTTTMAGLFNTVRADSVSSVTIENCYSDATISSGVNIGGGLIGWMDAVNKYLENIDITSTPGTLTVKNLVYLGNSVDGESAGKIAGAIYRDAGSGAITLDKLYAIDDVSVTSTATTGNEYDGLEVSSSDVLNQAFYEDILGWDFDTVWKMDSSVSPYPILQQTSTPEPSEAYTLTFNANGGSGSMTSATISAGDSYSLPACTFTAPEGQVFKAWDIDGTEYAAGASYIPTASVTVKAVWMVDDTPSPGSFTINAPVNGVVSWTASEGAASYTISLRDRTISETEDAGKLLNNEPVGSVTSYDISSLLVEGHSYRVAVCAYNDAGKETWAELEFGDCQHTNLVDVNINYKGITKDFPQNAGDGTHYWYVNVVCNDCDAVQQETVKRTAEHNANTLEKNGVCECNYHRYETGLSYTMYAIEDATTYLVPEAEDGYRGGSIDKEEEVTVFSDRLGDDGSWSLIQYSVTGTSREKVRFVKSEILVKSLEKGSITIISPIEGKRYSTDNNLEIHWTVSDGNIVKSQVRVLYCKDDGSNNIVDEEIVSGGEGDYKYDVTSLSSLLKNGVAKCIVQITGFNSKNDIMDVKSVDIEMIGPFVFSEDTWGFGNTVDTFLPYLELVKFSPLGNTYRIGWEDFNAILAEESKYTEQAKAVFETMTWGGTCEGMCVALIAIENNIFPLAGFQLDGNKYATLYEIKQKDLRATHRLYDTSVVDNLGHSLLQIQLLQFDKDVTDKRNSNGVNQYESILSLTKDDSLVLLGMIAYDQSDNSPHGNHAIVGYSIDTSNPDEILLHTYDPNSPGTSRYISFECDNGVITSWKYHGPLLGNRYDSNTHYLKYLSEADVVSLYFENMAEKGYTQIVDEEELLCIVNPVENSHDSFQVLNLDKKHTRIIPLGGSGISQELYRIPRDTVQLVAHNRGMVTISDLHSSVELTLDAGTTASVIVDDAKENSVEITSDDENTNHEFTVTYGYDSTADKGYQEATVKGTMSDSFKGEATENGLKLTGLDSAEILVENSKGESVSVETIQNADEYEDIVIDIDTSVKVTGNKDGVSDVLVSVPLNKVQYESSGSSKNTGSGNYAEYPRSVTNGGYVDFGTSPVVKGVTLPEGVSGKVVLIAKSKTPAPEGKEAYGVFEINVASYPTGEKAVISFTIPLADLQKKGFTEKDICLYHFDGEVWTKLPTTYTVEGDKVFYQAETTAFSPFAIIYEKDGATSAAVSEIPVEPENPSDEPVSTVPEIPSSSGPQETESPAPVLGMMLGGLGAAVLMRRK